MLYPVKSTLTLEDRILKSRVQIMRHDAFVAMSGILLMGKSKVCDKTPTAYTNGLDVTYGRKYCDPLDDAQLRWLILHEYFHVMLKHMIVWRYLWDEDAETANIAADIVINNWLDNVAGPGSRVHEPFLKMPPGGCIDHQFDNMDTGAVYRALKANPNKKKGGGKGSGKAGEGFDEHDFSGAPEDGDEGNAENGGNGGKQLTNEQLQELSKLIDETLRQGAQLAGKTGAKLDRNFNALVEVVTPWEDALRDFISAYTKGNDMSSWRRPARRWMSRGIYMPTHITESMSHMVVAMDLSGSISQRTHTRFMSEIVAAVNAVMPDRMDIVYWDHEVEAHETYEGEDVLRCNELTKPVGGGGTRIGCVKDFLNSKSIKPECIIILTDGYVESGWGGSNDWPAPILFCVTTKDLRAPYGTTLFIPEE